MGSALADDRRRGRDGGAERDRRHGPGADARSGSRGCVGASPGRRACQRPIPCAAGGEDCRTDQARPRRRPHRKDRGGDGRGARNRSRHRGRICGERRRRRRDRHRRRGEPDGRRHPGDAGGARRNHSLKSRLTGAAARRSRPTSATWRRCAASPTRWSATTARPTSSWRTPPFKGGSRCSRWTIWTGPIRSRTI